MYNKDGFSLIELIIVIAILGILMSIVFPLSGGFYSTIQEFNLDTASNELLSDMRLTQQKAISEGYYYNIYFNSSENSYMIYSYANMDNTVYKTKKLPVGIIFDKVRSTYRDNKISFNNRGKPLPFPCTIALKDISGRYRRITITVGTDYISLKKD